MVHVYVYHCQQAPRVRKSLGKVIPTCKLLQFDFSKVKQWLKSRAHLSHFDSPFDFRCCVYDWTWRSLIFVFENAQNGRGHPLQNKYRGQNGMSRNFNIQKFATPHSDTQYPVPIKRTVASIFESTDEWQDHHISLLKCILEAADFWMHWECTYLRKYVYFLWIVSSLAVKTYALSWVLQPSNKKIESFWAPLQFTISHFLKVCWNVTFGKPLFHEKEQNKNTPSFTIFIHWSHFLHLSGALSSSVSIF